MKVHEYLKTVEEQIRCKSIWEDIRTELLGHIEEDTEYFRRKGMKQAYHLLPLILGVEEEVPLGIRPFMNRVRRKFL